MSRLVRNVLGSARIRRQRSLLALALAPALLGSAVAAGQPSAALALAASSAGATSTGRSAATRLPAILRDGPSATQARSLSSAQRETLYRIAFDTWRFYRTDVDPRTDLPLDNLTYAGGSPTPTGYGRYTSSANVGVYLWAVVSALDLHLIDRAQAARRVNQTLRSVAKLKRYRGFLYQWYDTTDRKVLTNPGEAACAQTSGTFDNCSFVSNVDNGWYASGLIVARRALPGVKVLVNKLMRPMDFSIFYDGRPQTRCNTNPAVKGNQPTGQMYGGYYVGSPPTPQNASHYYHNGALFSDPRIGAYIGMGRHQMPGDVWWRTWRTLPPKAPYNNCRQTDPDFSWQGQWPVAGRWEKIRDPRSHKVFDVWEGHYTYPWTSLKFIPTFGGGMFEALMANAVIPETAWGPKSFGLADHRTIDVQVHYATKALGLPVWGMSPSSTADDSGGYGGFGVEGLKFPYYGQGATAAHPNLGLSQCHTCASEDTVTPHASFLALPVAPRRAYANIEKLRRLYPDVYGVGGFFDAVNPSTGSVGHRYLVLDQSMIMASLDNALTGGALQRHFAKDPISRAAKTYLGAERMTLG